MVWLLIGYMFLFIDRPFEVWPILGDMHLERVYMLLTMLIWLLSPSKKILPNLQQFAVALFALAVLFTWLMSPWMDAGQIVVENWFKILVFYIMLVTSVTSERDLKRMLVGFLVVMALYLLHSAKEFVGGRHVYRMGFSRMIGVDSSMGDPNSFGSTIIYSLPIVTIFWTTTATKRVKLLLLGYAVLCVMCILLTGSRGSLLGLLILGGAYIIRSRRIWIYTAAAAVFSPVVFLALPDSLQNRFETIINPEAGPENAQVSGQGRIDGFFTGMELLGQYPISGIGPGAWRPATRSIIESHNLYGQVAGEMGLIGIVTFGAMVGLALQQQMRMRRWERRQPARNEQEEFLFRTGKAVGQMFLMMLILGFFGHNLLRYNWLWFGGVLIISHHCLRIRLRKAAYQPMRVRLPRIAMPTGTGPLPAS